MKESSFKTIKSQYRVMTALALVLAALSSFSLQANATTGETIIGPANEAGPGRVDPPQTQARDFSGLVTQYNRSTDSQKTNLLNANPGLDRVLINSRTSGAAGATNTVTQPAATTSRISNIQGRPLSPISIPTLAAVPSVNFSTIEGQLAANGAATTNTEATGNTSASQQIVNGEPVGSGESGFAAGFEQGQKAAIDAASSGGGSSSSGGGFLTGIGQIASGGSTLAGMAGTFCSATNNRNCVNSIGKAVAQVGMANQFAQAIPRIPGAVTNAVNQFGAMGADAVNKARQAGSLIASGARQAGDALQARRNPPTTPPTGG